MLHIRRRSMENLST